MARPSVPATFLIGTRAVSFACGPCSLVVDPVGAFALPAGATDANGRAALRTPLPNAPALLGVKLIEQWLTAAEGGCALAGVAFSNAIMVEIQ